MDTATSQAQPSRVPALAGINRNMAIGFSAIVLALMLIVTVVGASFYSRISEHNEEELETVITGIVADSVNRISFSGKYHAGLLVERIVSSQPRIERIVIVSSTGDIIAHGSTESHARLLTKPAMDLAHRVATTGKPHHQAAISPNGTPLKRIGMPYRGGFQNKIIGAMMVEFASPQKETLLSRTWMQMALLITLLTLVSLVATYFLSNHFAGPVKTMAWQLRGILDYAPLMIWVTDPAGRIVDSSVSFETSPEACKTGLTERLRNVFDQKEGLALEWSYPSVDEERTFLVTGFPVVTGKRGKTHLACGIAMDITDRTRAELALRASEGKYRSLIANAAVPFTFWVFKNGEWHLDFLNEVSARNLAAEPTDLIGRTLGEVMEDAGFVALSRKRFEAIAEAGIGARFEDRITLTSGRIAWFESDIQPVKDPNDNVIAIQVISIDATERKLAEQERVANLRFLESLEWIDRVIVEAADLDQMMSNVLEVALDVFECDRAFLLYPCDPDSPSWCVPMERTRPEHPGAFAERVQAPMTPDMARDFRKLLADGQPLVKKLHPGEAEWDPEDQYHVRSLISSVVYPKTGKPWAFGLHFCSETREWTPLDQRLFQEIGHRLASGLSTVLYSRHLKESEEKHRLFVESFQGIAYQAEIESWKPHMFEGTIGKITGYVTDDFLTQATQWKEIIHAEDVGQAQHEVEKLLSEPDHVADCEYRILHKNGEIRWVRDVGRVIQIGDKKLVQGTVVDITDRKRAEAERAKLQEQLLARREREKELVEAELTNVREELVRKARLATLGRLTATVSHELRNPLGTIRGSLFTIKRATEGKELGIQRAFARVERNIDRCDNIIDELLDYTRSPVSQTESTNLDEWLTEILDEQVIPEGITLNRSLRTNLELPLDREKLRRCIVNLLTNACQAIQEKEPSQGQVMVETEQRNDRIELRIVDTGPGIDPSLHEKVFEPLYSTKGFGVGLGLSIVKQLIEAAGGGIYITNAPGSGASAVLWFSPDGMQGETKEPRHPNQP